MSPTDQNAVWMVLATQAATAAGLDDDGRSSGNAQRAILVRHGGLPGSSAEGLAGCALAAGQQGVTQPKLPSGGPPSTEAQLASCKSKRRIHS